MATPGDIILEAMTALSEISDDLDKHKFNIHVSLGVGRVASFIGSGMMLVGLVAEPYTLGLSTFLVIAGASVGVAGAGTAVGSVIAKDIIQSKKLDDAKRVYDRMFTHLHQLRNLRRVGDIGESHLPDEVSQTLRLVATVGGKSASESARVLVVKGDAVALLPDSLDDLIKSSIEGGRISSSSAGRGVRHLKDTLESIYYSRKLQ